MKLNDLIHVLETNRKSVSEAKRRVANLLILNSMEFEAKTQKKFDEAIDGMSKMMIAVYSEIKYKVDFKPYDDYNPFFVGPLLLKEGYVLDTEISICVGMLNSVMGEIEKLKDESQVFHPYTMTQVQLGKKFKKLEREVVDSLSSTSKAVNSIIVVDEPKAKKEVKKPAAKKPATKKATKKPAEKKPAAKKPAAKKAPAKKKVVKKKK